MSGMLAKVGYICTRKPYVGPKVEGKGLLLGISVFHFRDK